MQPETEDFKMDTGTSGAESAAPSGARTVVGVVPIAKTMLPPTCLRSWLGGDDVFGDGETEGPSTSQPRCAQSERHKNKIPTAGNRRSNLQSIGEVEATSTGSPSAVHVGETQRRERERRRTAA